MEQEEITARARPRYVPSTFSSLAYRDYRYLWLSMMFSSAGQWIQQVTLGWLVYEMTGSPLMLGLVNGVRAVPFLISGPFAGVAADRMDRKKLMMVTQSCLMATAFGMGLLVYTGLVEVWHVFAFTLLTGIAWSFNQPVRQTLIPNVVPSHALLNAITLNSAGGQAMRILGPSLAGVLIGVTGVGGNFFLQGIAYLGVMVMIYLMKVPPNPGNTKALSIRGSLMEGFRYVKHHDTVFPLMLMALLPQLFYLPYTSLMPIFAKDVLFVGPEGLGLLMAAPAVGAVTASLAVASLGNFRQKGLLLLGAGMCAGFFLVLYGTSSWFPLSLILLVGVGVGGSTFFATSNTLVQEIVPDELRGRVMAIYMLDQGIAPLGSLFAGAMASMAGAPMAQQVMGGLLFSMAFIVLVRTPQIRRLE